MKARLIGPVCGIMLICLQLFTAAGFVEAAPHGRRVLVEATAYSPEDPGLNSTTALGTRLRKGVIAVDPDFIPLGSHVYIPDYGEAVAEDVGGAIIGNVIDVAFNTHAEALEFGRQEIYIYLLDEEEEATDTEEPSGEAQDTDEEEEDSEEKDSEEKSTEPNDADNENDDEDENDSSEDKEQEEDNEDDNEDEE